jgi:peptide/nickel transport system substrate-binding protein
MRSPFRVATATAAFALAAVVVTGCTAAPSDEETSIRIGVNSGNLAAQYDPALAFVHATDVSGIYETLYTYDTKTAALEPLLGTSYELSTDRRTLTVELRDDVEFVGGNPMTAEAVAESLTLMAAAEDSQLFGTSAEYGATYEAAGEYTLEITATKAMDVPGGFFEIILGGIPIADPESFADREAAAQSPMGTGPYLIDEVVPEVSAKLVRNPDYWDPDRYPFDEVTILAFDDDVARLNALSSGQIDAGSLGLTVAQEATDAGFVASTSEAGRFTALWIADRAGTIVPALADIRVREAMQLAFDRETINETLNRGYGFLTSQPGISSTGEYVEGGDDRYGYDPDRARELMAEAGYADGFEFVLPTTTFLGVSDWAPVVQQSLADIGITVTLEPFSDASAWFGAAMSGEYPVIMYREQPGDMARVFLIPDALFNNPHFDDPVVAEAWDTVLNGTSEEAEAARHEIGARSLDEAWMVVIANSKVLWFSKEGITVEVDGAGYPHLDQFGLS